MGRYQRERELIEQLRAAMCVVVRTTRFVIARRRRRSTDGDAVPAYRAHQSEQPLKMIQHSLTMARITLYPQPSADSFAKEFDETDDLSRAEHHLRGAIAGQNGWSTINTLMSSVQRSLFVLDHRDGRGRPRRQSVPAPHRGLGRRPCRRSVVGGRSRVGRDLTV